MPPGTDDAELVRRSLAGEGLAFAQLVEKHQRLVFGVALSTARDAAEAEDVAQEAFVEAWRDLRRLRDPGRVGTWIAGIARNLAQRWRRRTARRRRHESAAGAAASEAAPTALDGVLDSETSSAVRDALREIPAAYRETLVLYYVHGQSVREVACGLGITEDLAKQRLSRGRRALRASFETRVEDALAQMRPGKTFTATVMIAVGATAVRSASASAAAGRTLLAMKATKLVVIAVAIVLAAAVAWYARSPAPRQVQHHRRDLASTPLAPALATRSAEPPRDAATPRVRKLADPTMRAQLLLAIRSAHRQRTAPPAMPSAAPSRASSGSAVAEASDDPDADYIRDAMTDLLPMVVDCYKQARIAHPSLAGKLVVNFTIEGEPGVGGVVTESSIDPEKSELKDQALGECVQETMFALEIDPPTNGGTVHVTFPFTFRPKD